MIKISNGMFYENIDTQYKKFRQAICLIAKLYTTTIYKYKIKENL